MISDQKRVYNLYHCGKGKYSEENCGKLCLNRITKKLNYKKRKGGEDEE